MEDEAKAEKIKALGAEIRKVRLARGISQAKLASMVGTDQAVIARLEAGRHNAGIGAYIRVADALDVSLKSLIKF